VSGPYVRLVRSDRSDVAVLCAGGRRARWAQQRTGRRGWLRRRPRFGRLATGTRQKREAVIGAERGVQWPGGAPFVTATGRARVQDHCADWTNEVHWRSAARAGGCAFANARLEAGREEEDTDKRPPGPSLPATLNISSPCFRVEDLGGVRRMRMPFGHRAFHSTPPNILHSCCAPFPLTRAARAAGAARPRPAGSSSTGA
jgi:hypothetical protein